MANSNVGGAWLLPDRDLMGWMAPYRHQRAKLVAVESHQDRSHPPCRLQRLASIWPSMSSKFTVLTRPAELVGVAEPAMRRELARTPRGPVPCSRGLHAAGRHCNDG